MSAVQTVFKYPISMTADVRVRMPKGATVVAVNIDNTGNPCIWALVDPDMRDTEERKFGIYGTGGMVPGFWHYQGTFFDMPFVWHVFEEMAR